jgi:hypothetical protein
VSSPPGRTREVTAAPRDPGQHGRPAAIASYTLLVIFGLLQGLVGAFQYSRGPAGLAAIGFDVLILATCLFGAWGMRTPGGGLAAGLGWFVAAFVMSMGTKGGSVLITNTAAGKWFLFGGAAGAAAGCLTSYLKWSRAGLGGRRPS